MSFFRNRNGDRQRGRSSKLEAKLEAEVKPRAGGMGPNDFGLGTELLDGIDDAELERRMTVERNNGRLAMVAIMGLMVQASVGVWFKF